MIKAVFAGIEDKSVHTAMEAEEGLLPEEEEEETDQPSTSTLSKAMTKKQPSSSKAPPKKASKRAVPCCSLNKASIIYLSKKDRKLYLHAGVDDRFISSHQSSSISQKRDMGVSTAPLCRKKGGH